MSDDRNEQDIFDGTLDFPMFEEIAGEADEAGSRLPRFKKRATNKQPPEEAAPEPGTPESMEYYRMKISSERWFSAVFLAAVAFLTVIISLLLRKSPIGITLVIILGQAAAIYVIWFQNRSINALKQLKERSEALLEKKQKDENGD